MISRKLESEEKENDNGKLCKEYNERKSTTSKE